jgi:phosphoglycolate phosphatase
MMGAASNLPPTLAAAIVDLDGTMVDTAGDFVVALGRTLTDLGLPPIGREFVLRTVGKGSDHLIRQTLALTQAPADVDRLYLQAWERYQHHYLEINGDHADVFPGVVEGLTRLADLGLPLACLTNKPTAFAEPLLEKKGLRHHFRAVFGGDAFERKKPDPLPLWRTCEALGTTPARTLMIGDSVNDAAAARAAGCPVVLVTYGYNHGEPVHNAPADAFVDRIDQISWGFPRG